MLRLTPEIRTMLESAKKAGTTLYATGGYAQWLLWAGPYSPPEFSTSGGFDPLNPNDFCHMQRVMFAGVSYDFSVDRDREFVIAFLKKYSRVTGTHDVLVDGKSIGQVTIAEKTVPVYVNGSRVTFGEAPASLTGRVERIAWVNERLGLVSSDVLQFGTEDPFFVDESARHSVEVDGIWDRWWCMENPVEELKTALRPGTYTWRYSHMKGEYKIVVPKTIQVRYPFTSGYVTVELNPNEDVYQAAVTALKAAGKRPPVVLESGETYY